MIWPGTSDPYKRKKTIRFLIIAAVIGIGVAAATSAVQSVFDSGNPIKVCIDDRNTPFKLQATLELYVDGRQVDLPANIGVNDNCQRSMYTLTGDGTIYAEWEEEYPFEIGHFLWMWDFPLRDMNQDKSAIYVDGVESPYFIKHLLEDGSHYRAIFTSKAYDESKGIDFLPPET